ncbi:uncharacterized protein LOC120334796 [Styela clava]
MNLFEILFFISLICGLVAELKVPAGSCVSKIVNGKLVQVGDCKKDDGSEIARLIKKSLDEKTKAEIKCDVKYDSKCFRSVVYAEANVTFNVGKFICKSMNNGKPANIYDLAHLQMLLSDLRSLKADAGRKYIRVWTGMEYKDNQLLLSSGEPITIATGFWHVHYPTTNASLTNVILYVDEDPVSVHQGISDISLSARCHGVICEI